MSWFGIAAVCAVAGAFFAWRAISESLDKIFGACDEGPRDYGMAARELRSRRPDPRPYRSGRAPQTFAAYHRQLRRERRAYDRALEAGEREGVSPDTVANFKDWYRKLPPAELSPFNRDDIR